MNKKNLYAIPAMLAIATVVPFTPAIAQVQDAESNISVVDQEVDPQAALQWEDSKTANPGDTVTFRRLTPTNNLTVFPVSSTSGDITVRFDAYGNAIVHVPKTTRASEFNTKFEYMVGNERHIQNLNLKINQPTPPPVTITPTGIDQEIMLKPGESRTITPRKSLPPGMSWEFAGGRKTTAVGSLFTATINPDNTITIKANDKFMDGPKDQLTGTFTAVANGIGFHRSTDLFRVTIYRDPADAKPLQYKDQEGGKEIEINPGESKTLTPTETFGPGAKLTIPSSLGGGWSVRDAGKGDGTIIVTAPKDVPGMKSVGFGVIIKDPNNQNLESGTYLNFITKNPSWGKQTEQDVNKFQIEYSSKEQNIAPGGTVTFKNVGSKLPEGSNLSFMVPQGWDIKQGENGDIIVTSVSDKHMDGAFSEFNAVVTYPDGSNELVPNETDMLRVNVKGERVAPGVDVSQPGTGDNEQPSNPADNSGNTGDSTGDSTGSNTDQNNNDGSSDLTARLQVPNNRNSGSNSNNSSSRNSDDNDRSRGSSDEEDKYYNRPTSRSGDGSSSDKNDSDKNSSDKNSSDKSRTSNGGGAKVISSNGADGSGATDQNNLGGYGQNDGGMGNTVTSSYGNTLSPAAGASGQYGPKVDTGGSIDNIWTKVISYFK